MRPVVTEIVEVLERRFLWLHRRLVERRVWESSVLEGADFAFRVEIIEAGWILARSEREALIERWVAHEAGHAWPVCANCGAHVVEWEVSPMCRDRSAMTPIVRDTIARVR